MNHRSHHHDERTHDHEHGHDHDPFRRGRGDFGFFGPFGPPPFLAGRGGRGRGGPGGRGPGGRVPRGNVRAATLALLTERPMHGYEIISELESRTGGVWRPSPGSVYPTLQLLEDEGLVTSSEEGGKRRFSLTDEGRAQAAERGDGPTPWDEVTAGIDPASHGLRESAMLLVSALSQVARAGRPEQFAEASAILDEARRRLYGLLAGSGEE